MQIHKLGIKPGTVVVAKVCHEINLAMRDPPKTSYTRKCELFTRPTMYDLLQNAFVPMPSCKMLPTDQLPDMMFLSYVSVLSVLTTENAAPVLCSAIITEYVV